MLVYFCNLIDSRLQVKSGQKRMQGELEGKYLLWMRVCLGGHIASIILNIAEKKRACLLHRRVISFHLIFVIMYSCWVMSQYSPLGRHYFLNSEESPLFYHMKYSVKKSFIIFLKKLRFYENYIIKLFSVW